MAKFASPSKQAATVIKQLQGRVLRSVGTARNYEQALTRVAEYAQENKIKGGLVALDQITALSYLEYRGQFVGQKTLDMERQAIQAMMQHVTGQLEPSQRLSTVKSEIEQALTGRAYSARQVELVIQAQTVKHSFATELAYAAGLRAHELLTLARIDERTASPRPSSSQKWTGREGVIYTVYGKGGLVREVLIPTAISEKLELTRLAQPKTVKDRNVNYLQRYQIGGGHQWSRSFNAASNRALGWSRGAHGVRHSYAQERMIELQNQSLTRLNALEIVSQEMGHFRPEITLTYLR
jgi:integrase